MTDPGSAAEHLRVIRNLMERATVYRFISAPVALVGGTASLTASFVLFQNPPSNSLFFLLPWLAVLLATMASNTLFMQREARFRKAPVFSPAFRHALLAILPALVAGLLIGCLALQWSYFHAGAFWCLFYGLGLLATRPYAPRSMQVLAWFFFATGLFSLLLLNHPRLHDARAAAAYMAATFGLYHLVYGFVVGRETRFRLSPARLMIDFFQLDKTIHETGRLAIMTLLAARPEWTFPDIKQELQMSDGNLITHLRKLEDAGYLSMRKEPQLTGRPITRCFLTGSGRQAFIRYLQLLEEIVKANGAITGNT